MAKAAAAVAFLIAAAVITGAFTSWPIVSFLYALPPLFAGIAIVRGHAAAAYGFALLCAADVVGNVFIAGGSSPITVAAMLTSAAFGVALGILFFAAGRSLRARFGMQGWLSPWIAVAGAAMLLPVFLQTYVQNSASMENTLLKGDKFFVVHPARPELERGSLVTFHYPLDRKQVYVKRIVGVPGDRIRLADKTVYRNGVALTEPYAIHTSAYVDPYRDNFPAVAPSVKLPERAVNMLAHDIRGGELIVQPGEYFVLGDNRDDSLDSRYFGCVPAADVVGKAVLIYDSRDGGKVRWDRLFRRL